MIMMILLHVAFEIIQLTTSCGAVTGVYPIRSLHFTLLLSYDCLITFMFRQSVFFYVFMLYQVPEEIIV